MNGASEPESEVTLSEGFTVAAIDDGHGSVRNVPRSSPRAPLRQRATTRKR